MIISNANKIYLGNQTASKIYIGSNLVFSSLWSPDQLGSSLALWLDASDTNTIILNGLSVSQWGDKSGNNNNAVQPIASNQPLYNSVALNTKPTIQFNGASSIMRADSAALSIGTQDFVVMIVMRFSSIGGRFFSLRRDSGTTNRAYLARYTNNQYVGYFGSPLTTSETVNVADNSVCMLGCSKIGNTAMLYSNGNSYTPISATFPSAFNILTLGGVFSSADSNVWFSEIIVNTGSTTQDNLQKTEGYLAHKWNLASRLPSNHPYKNFAP